MLRLDDGFLARRRELSLAQPGVPQPATRDLPDPLIRPEDEGQVRYSRHVGQVFIEGARAKDVRQGGIADCNLLAALASVAEQEPEAIENAIQANADGTYTIRLYEMPHPDGFRQNGDGTWTVANPSARLEPGQLPQGSVRELTIDADLPERYGARAYSGSTTDGELWVSLFEKAFAELQGGYGTLGLGSPGALMAALTGRPERFLDTGALSPDETYEVLSQALAAGQSLSASTYGKDLKELYIGTGIAAWHWYSVLGVSAQGDQRYVHLRNPWASGEPSSDGVNDGVFQLTVEEFSRLFKGTYAS